MHDAEGMGSQFTWGSDRFSDANETRTNLHGIYNDQRSAHTSDGAIVCREIKEDKKVDHTVCVPPPASTLYLVEAVVHSLGSLHRFVPFLRLDQPRQSRSTCCADRLSDALDGSCLLLSTYPSETFTGLEPLW